MDVQNDSPKDPTIHEFVMSCLRYRLGTGSILQLETQANKIEFEPQPLLEYARTHKVASLLYLTVKDTSILPERTVHRLHQSYRETAQVNLFLQHAFQQVLHTLVKYDISTAVIKGILFIEEIYQDPSLRPFSDLDIVIKREEIAKAVECLKGMGFDSITEPYPGQALDFEKELLFTKPGIVNVMVDLHWILFGPTYYHQTRIPQDFLWELTEPIRIGNIVVESWPIEIQILHMTSHLMMDHAQEGILLWWYDLAALIHKNLKLLRWNLIIDTAQRLELILPLRASFIQISDDWGVAIPKEIMKRIENLHPSTKEREVYNWRRRPELLKTRRAWEALLALNGTSLRLRYIFMRLFPSTAYIRSILPGSHSTLSLYPIYWLRGIKMVISLLTNR